MTAHDFRKLALACPDAIESAHMNHPDFRVAGKIFATLGYPDKSSGMVKLTPAQQRSFVRKAPDAFRPCSGVWGVRGCTNVYLPSATQKLVRPALAAAFLNATVQAKKRANPSKHQS